MAIRTARKFLSSRSLVWFALALACGGAAVFLGWHHPIAPLVCLAAVVAAFVACFWRQGLWLFLIPACLPWLNFAPWTGWVLIEEFDLLLLTVLAAGYSRLAAYSVEQDRAARTDAGRALQAPVDRVIAWLVFALLLSVGAGLAKGLLDAGSLRFNLPLYTASQPGSGRCMWGVPQSTPILQWPVRLSCFSG